MNKATIIFLDAMQKQNKLKNKSLKHPISPKTMSSNAWSYRTCNQNPQDPIA